MSFLLRNRFLGGVSSLATFAPDNGTGAGGAAAGAAPAAGAAAPAAGEAAAAPAAAAAAPAAGAAAPAGGAATLAGGAGDPGSAAAAAAATAGAPKFPDNWRDVLAGEDKDAAKDLAKYTDPSKVYQSLRELQAKISKGELKAPAAPLPANATDEQKAAWRQANGLPATAEDYVKGLQLPDGLVVGEADKGLVDDFAKAMFEGGASQSEMNRAVSWFYGMQDKMEQQRQAADGQTRVASEVALRQEWGADYAANMNAMGAVFGLMPQDLLDSMLTARTPDGQLLGNTPGFVKAMVQLGRELNPAATIVPAGDANAAKTIDAEIESIKSSMYDAHGQPNPAYWNNEKTQARYRELVDTQMKMASRGKAA